MLREDGRRLDQIRNIDFQVGFDKQGNGSCHYLQGLTEVICLVNGPKEVINLVKYASQKTQDELLVIEYSVSPFSSVDSKRNSKFDKEFSQFAEVLRHTFQNLIIMDPNTKTEIIISVCVIQNDGSSKSAIFNAVNMALMDAGIPMKDFLVSCSVGLHNGLMMADLTQEESRNAFAEVTISYQSRKKKTDFFELRSQKISIQEVEQLIKQSVIIAEEIYTLLRASVLSQSIKRLLM